MASLPLPPVILKDYSIGEKIGAGTYGTVFKATKKTGPREVVAVKAIYKKGLVKKEVDNIISEITLLKTLKHQHIVEMVDFTWDTSYIYIIMEYCGGGDLSRFIRLKKILARVCRQKPQNILITQSRVLKLADFGFAKKIKLSQKEMGIRGSPLYMAPEMLLEKRYDAKVDIWSVGVILYECLFGYAPYKSSTTLELYEKIKEDIAIEIPTSGISVKCSDLLKRCLDRHPETRIDFEEFLSHPFMDLEHIPCQKKLYKESLEYFVPLLHDESDPNKKVLLRKKVDGFIIRAETLKEALGPIKPLGKIKNFENNKSSETLVPNKESSSQYKELSMLSGSTPGLKSSIDILHQAELYEAEGRLKYALEQYESGLKIIMPILINEPKGHRRTLMNAKIQRWMSLKTLTE
ncbi:serine/threonine-protein kinase ULK3-like [Lepeophtheirus salmonis]|uniref:serine/threonine-protein kinase ULK3-like n=1 Tax=Lepeophtheirus salmonis TaxID=72036 RepID=UPI001AE1495B|nr:serine/threonine-protein kinase ULK3-like [Lepeophtheirus salmonis]